ncbi:hypothetical protein CRE_17754 [Caenorhabditis remanei]|uniref:Uncharacterized protein n=1 Tax=Caenorhabditis remanei TaxID=31234 RepID=E3NS43_CAERE|nr:hypothetical protein CRE_17754 [Caenorhabditis remanei]
MPPKLSKIANKHNAMKGHDALENRHEKIKRELRDKLSDALDRITESEAEIVDLKKIIKQKDEEIAELKVTLMNKDEIEKQLENVEKALESSQQSSEFVGNQVVNLRRENISLKDKINFLNNNVMLAEKNKEQSIRDAVLARNCESIHRKKALEMKDQLNSMMLTSPSAGNKKRFGELRKKETRNARCQKMVDYMEKELGNDDLEAFLISFCNFIADDPKYTFKTCLSAMDSFIATVKWRFSDGLLKELKHFLRERLGFDVFASRHKIHALRKLHSNMDHYNIVLRNIVRKEGSREIEGKTADISVKDVKSLLALRLQRLHESRQLRMNGPDDDVVIGVGGDKGGRHTKLVCVLGNTDNPNNPHGIQLLGMYEGQDDYESLKKHLLPVFQMLNEMDSITYMEGSKEVTRRVVKVPIGDCKFLSAILGHSGQSSSCPCFLCKLKWSSHGAAAARLSTFDFSVAGDQYLPSDLKQPLLVADPSSICPPALHTLLGIVQKYIINWLHALCNSIDHIEPLPESTKDQKKLMTNLAYEVDHYRSRFNKNHPDRFPIIDADCAGSRDVACWNENYTPLICIGISARCRFNCR